MHGITNFLKICPNSLLGAFTQYLWRLDDVFGLLRFHQFGIVFVEETEDPLEEFGVQIVSIAVGPRRASLLRILFLFLFSKIDELVFFIVVVFIGIVVVIPIVVLVVVLGFFLFGRRLGISFESNSLLLCFLFLFGK